MGERIVKLAIGRAGGWSAGKMLCLKPLHQFLSHLNEMCFTWSLWGVDVYDIICVTFPGVVQYHK